MDLNKEIKIPWYEVRIFLRSAILVTYLLLTLSVAFPDFSYEYIDNIPLDICFIIYFLSGFIFIPYFILKQLFSVKYLTRNFFSITFYLINNAMLLVLPFAAFCYSSYVEMVEKQIIEYNIYSFDTEKIFYSDVISIELYIFLYILFLISNYLVRKFKLTYSTRKKILFLFAHLIIFAIFLLCACFCVMFFILVSAFSLM